jgi:hypothetical protein
MVYDIRVRGQMGSSIAAAFDDFEITTGPGTTTLRGDVVDQAALHGIINRIERLGLVLLDVHAEAE